MIAVESSQLGNWPGIIAATFEPLEHRGCQLRLRIEVQRYSK